MGNRFLKMLVVLLCSINAVMWQIYTESPLMATLWAGTAVGFVFWIIDDIRRG